MNEIFEKISSDLEKEKVTLKPELISELKASVLMLDDEFVAKLVMVAGRYLVEISKKEEEIKALRKEVYGLNKQCREFYKSHGASYKDVMEDKKKNKIYPADKHVSLEAVRKLQNMGLSKQEICDSLGISRSTLWRKEKELKQLPELPESGVVDFSKLRLDSLKG